MKTKHLSRWSRRQIKTKRTYLVVFTLLLSFTVMLAQPAFVSARALFAPAQSRRAFTVEYLKDTMQSDGTFTNTLGATTSGTQPTAEALQSLILLDALEEINMTGSAYYISELHITRSVEVERKLGGFSETPGGDVSLHASYYATLILYRLNETDMVNKTLVLQWLGYRSSPSSPAYNNMDSLPSDPQIRPTLMIINMYKHMGEVDQIPNQTALVDWIFDLQDSQGGFASKPNETTNLYSTYAAVQILDLLNQSDQIDTDLVSEYLMGHYTEEGGFTSELSSDTPDIYATFWALSTLRIIDKLSEVSPENVTTWITSLQTSSGGFTSLDGGAASTSATYHAIASLHHLDQLSILDNIPPWENTALTFVEIVIIGIGVALAIVLIRFGIQLRRMD